jgi:phosphoribosyl 1,2-cyclic phosphodiesterase
LIRFSSLASSSVYGNSYLVEGPDGTRVLIDCGARQRRMLADLRSLGVEPATISAVLLTHEHADHVYWLGLRHPALAGCGARLLAHPLVWEACPAATGYMACAQLPVSEDEFLVPGRLTQIGSLTIEPFSTPHDAVAPLGFVVHSDGSSLGFATDLGHLPAAVAAKLAGCTHLVLEANHDRQLELNSGRPWRLIERVLGPEGHLSNDQTAAALHDLVTGATRSVVLAHLSLECNVPSLALAAAETSLPHGRGGWTGRLVAAPPASPSGWIG